MRFARWVWVTAAIAVGGGVVASTGWTLRAQDRAVRSQPRPKADPGVPRPNATSIQDALLRPIDLPFGEETTLEEVRQFLAKALGGQVVLDRSALDRLDLVAEDTVQLDLKGVRLKVGLKLLLDQVGLSFRVVPEDNLLILTDPEGSDDPGQRALGELKSLHREIHDLQDSVDDLRDLVEEDLGFEPEKAGNRSTFVRGRPARAQRRPTRGVGG